MLVLTRKVGESLVIAGNITLTVVSLDSGKVRIGVVAPPEVRVDRQEIHDRRANEQPQESPEQSGIRKPPPVGIRRSRLVPSPRP